jgi:cellulose synthase/poly-beta-1,6-N-acetylglucosamine synthase-like glycosyltransferase
MKTVFFFVMCFSALLYMIQRLLRVPAIDRFRCIDAIVPAYNEALCIEQALINLLRNPYIRNVICVDDGSSDRTPRIIDALAARTNRLIPVYQQNTGKGGAIMHGLQYVAAPFVFLTDADTYVPPRAGGLGYMLAEIERGAHAVGGVPSSNLSSGGLLPFVRATVKFPMVIAKRTFQQILGGAPFLISGACGLFRTDVLREVGLSDRTKVEDLDLTWTLVERGYRVRQCNFCIVYPQECHTLREEWLRWRRWIMGYSVCMRLHWRLLLTRFGLFSMLPMFLVAVVGIALSATAWTRTMQHSGPSGIPTLIYPLAWVALVAFLGAISAVHHRRYRLMFMAPLSIAYLMLAYSVWLVHGLKSLVTGREFGRDKPTRYADVVA